MRLEAAIPTEVLAAVRAPFVEAGGTSVETAAAEPLSLYLDLAGEALRERLFLVQGPGREEYCLRPDFTLGVAQVHIASGVDTARYLYEGPAFRVAPAGSERPEQFLQIGLEAYGSGEAAIADGEMASLAWRAATAGGRDDLFIQLGDVGLFAAFLADLGVAQPLAARLGAAVARPSRLKRTLDAAVGGARPERASPLAAVLRGLPTGEATAVLEDVWALSGVEPVGGRGAEEIVHRLVTLADADGAARLAPGQREAIDRYLAIAAAPTAALAQVGALAKGPAVARAAEAWARRLAAMAAIPPERIRLSTAFARPFGYYDGVLFEVRSAALGADLPVAAGGRYDSLPARLGARSTGGAIGCMARPGRAWRGGGG